MTLRVAGFGVRGFRVRPLFPRRHPCGRHPSIDLSLTAIAAEYGRNLALAAIDLLQRSIEQPPSLAQAATALGVSPRQLQRLFATHLGTSFKRFGRGLRLEWAREPEQTGMTVMAVAVATGFGSVEHFGWSYRAAFGTSPGQGRAAEYGARSKQLARGIAPPVR